MSLIHYWALDSDTLSRRLESSPNGLSHDEAAQRLERHGRNELRESIPLTRLRVFWNQLRNPLLLLLVFAAGASSLTGEWVDAGIVFAIVLATVGVGYAREYSAQSAAEALRARVRTRSTVVRQGAQKIVALEDLVPVSYTHLTL